MRLFLLNFYRFLSEGHAVITLAAYCQVKLINLIFNIEDKNSIAFFVALTTFSIYNFYSVFTAFFNPLNFEQHRIVFWRLNKYFYLGLLLTASLILILKYYFLIPVFLNFPRHHFFIFSILTVLSVFYGVPIFGNRSLRDFPFVKIFIISSVWVFMVVLLPMIIYSPPISNIILGWMLIEKFSFLFALTLLCDINDAVWDQKSNMKTIPIYFGTKNTVYLIYSLLLFRLVIDVYFYFQIRDFSLAVLISCIITVLLCVLLILFYRKKTNFLSESLFFKDWADSLLICPWLILSVLWKF